MAVASADRLSADIQGSVSRRQTSLCHLGADGVQVEVWRPLDESRSAVTLISVRMASKGHFSVGVCGLTVMLQLFVFDTV